ncbi:MAG: hypothetical protein FWC56_02780, partial [Phycisphaerae bacterium]|nr:hypothetical protein [Phycisphaerae bacterium]
MQRREHARRLYINQWLIAVVLSLLLSTMLFYSTSVRAESNTDSNTESNTKSNAAKPISAAAKATKPTSTVAEAGATSQTSAVAEPVLMTELLAFPRKWTFRMEQTCFLLGSDDQLRQLADPDQKVNLSTSASPDERTLRQICEQAKAQGHHTLYLAFDHFFAQYRPGQASRQLTPDRPETIALLAKISQFAQQYGLGLGLSLITPLEVGPAYAAETGECGVWMHYRKGLRDPKSGAYSVQLWRQTHWTNNKGAINIEDAGVRVFAFREQRLYGTPYIFVDPKSIVDISSTAQVETWPDSRSDTGYRIRVHSQGHGEGHSEKQGEKQSNQSDKQNESNTAAGCDRVLVVQMYKTPEMDYFSERAPGYLRQLVDRYVDGGVKLSGLYSDEMHIQQDWKYFSHHEHGQFAMRYVSPGFAKQFAARYGQQYEDFARWLIYFCYGQDDFLPDLSANDRLIHVWGTTPGDIQATALFRSRYYKLLQDGVVELFVGAKKYAEHRLGNPLDARAHATWAQSPTIDSWQFGQSHYEYTPGFRWSNTVHQSSAACSDYFRWGDFLTGNGNDFAEGGWLDRNYYGLAMAASTGILNEVPNSYAHTWGSPHEITKRRYALNSASGVAADLPYAYVQNGEHRDVSVLMLYPLDLVAAEERFGSWMTQYGYANYVTQQKLLERGQVGRGAIEMAGRRFTTLVALFEPFPSRRLLEMMQQLVDAGGCVVWSGPPPILADDGSPILETWQTLFGVTYTPTQLMGLGMPGFQVRFEGPLVAIPPMQILTDFLVDRVYPLQPAFGITVLACVKDHVVGTARKSSTGGRAVVLAFRPRDDQSGSLGHEERHWFDILYALGAYPPTKRLWNMSVFG